MKVDLTMAIWGISFGILATLTGMFLLAALVGGFLAEGFFLVVLGWVMFLVIVARVTNWIKASRKRREEKK